jgi:hypothetical protein
LGGADIVAQQLKSFATQEQIDRLRDSDFGGAYFQASVGYAYDQNLAEAQRCLREAKRLTTNPKTLKVIEKLLQEPERLRENIFSNP